MGNEVCLNLIVHDCVHFITQINLYLKQECEKGFHIYMHTSEYETSVFNFKRNTTSRSFVKRALLLVSNKYLYVYSF